MLDAKVIKWPEIVCGFCEERHPLQFSGDAPRVYFIQARIGVICESCVAACVEMIAKERAPKATEAK